MSNNARYAMVIDLRCCAGCHACTVSCKSQHDVPLGHFRTRVDSVELGRFPKVKRHFVPMLCNQCEDAPCIPSCPTEAIYRTEDGIVHINDDACVGAGNCISACPYDAMYRDPETGRADKCDFCSDRLEDELQPSCVASCPTEAFTFGDLQDPDDPIHALLAEHRPRGLKEEEGAGPKVFYIDLPTEVEQRLDGINPGDRERLYRVKRG